MVNEAGAQHWRYRFEYKHNNLTLYYYVYEFSEVSARAQAVLELKEDYGVVITKEDLKLVGRVSW